MCSLFYNSISSTMSYCSLYFLSSLISKTMQFMNSPSKICHAAINIVIALITSQLETQRIFSPPNKMPTAHARAAASESLSLPLREHSYTTFPKRVGKGFQKEEKEGNTLYRPVAYCVDCPDIWHVNISIKI